MDADKRQILVRMFFAGYSDTRINTSLEFTEGGMTVIATSQIQDVANSDINSLIVFVTAKVI